MNDDDPEAAAEPRGRAGFARWLQGEPEQPEGPVAAQHADEHVWWKVLALTGVDYFSTLGYLPGIALVTAGALAPFATILVVLLTLLGVLPVYRRVAAASPDGQGSVAMIEQLLGFWRGKLIVLTLLGFVFTAWLFTITVSAADATAHIVESPLLPEALGGHPVGVTLVLLAVLGAVFLRGFREVIGVALVVVFAYLALTAVVAGYGIVDAIRDPSFTSNWWDSVRDEAGSPLGVLFASLVVFPQLALGLSGFETGVGLMPHVSPGTSDDDPARRLELRIRNTRRLLLAAAAVMSVYLVATSVVTALHVPEALVAADGEAEGRALSWYAHGRIGEGFGNVYDLSTITILWFAGASAMAGLLNIVPRFLPRYGMAPEWATLVRPLVLVYTGLAMAVTIWFGARVDRQAGAYATGVLAMMISAAFAVALSAWRKGERRAGIAFATVAVALTYALIANELKRPDGITISLVFVVLIVMSSFASRVWRTTELRTSRIELDDAAAAYVKQAARAGGIHLLAHRPRDGNARAEYARKEREQREDNRIPKGRQLLFLEIERADPSDFEGVLEVSGHDIGGFRVLRATSPVVPNSIAALLLYLRDLTGTRPHCYFGWSEVHPFRYMVRYVLFGEGDTAPLCREVLRTNEPDPTRRPSIHVAG
ncbi:MAG: amino acid transporter [Thermoleophilia bacterium]|nr:amino acid transporter [Thermoleophilia bacterium]